MVTYQDLLEVGEREQERMDFIKSAISQHETTELYKTAKTAELYNRHRNPTMENFKKLLYTVSGKAIPDNWSANYKMKRRFFNLFITQENQYLLGNGITWGKPDTAKKLGEDFEQKLQDAGEHALVGGVGFGFFNLDHLEAFAVTEFVPLYDETDGALKAGIRYWQVDAKKPLRATLYELDGYTEYIWIDGDGEIKQEKRKYIQNVTRTPAEGTIIYDGENYPSFPIVPIWGNPQHQSELVGLQEQIDCYDLIKSGFANTVDEASYIYWTLNNAGGMDDIDLTEFVERIKTVHATRMGDGVDAQAHTIEAPYQSRESLLERLRSDLYEDAMALDTKSIAGGAITATQIMAAYEPLNNKVDRYEMCIKDFLRDILALAGIDDTPTFTRSKIVNTQEEITVVLQAATYLPEEYVTEKILMLLGDGDKAAEILKEMELEESKRSIEEIGDIDETDEEGEGTDGQGNPEATEGTV